MLVGRLGAALTTLLILTVLTPPARARVAGGGSSRSDCYAEFDGVTATSGTRVDCVDGDPACDADGGCGNGCAVSVAVCAYQSDVADCTPQEITGFPVNSASLTLPPTPITAPVCAAPTQVAVALRKSGKKAGKRVIRLVASASAPPRKDKDKLVLRCLPRTDACPGPTSSTLTSTTTVSSSTGPTTSTTTLPCTTGLGPRTFSVATTGAFFTSALGGSSAATPGTFGGAIGLCAGAPDGNGVASLTVNADSIFGFRVADASIICVKIEAAGSTGKLDCDGGTPVGVLVTVDSHGTAANDPAAVVATEQGAAGVAGSGYFVANTRIDNCDATPDPESLRCLAPVTTAADCADPAKFNFDAVDPEPHVFTTGTSTSTVLNPRPTSPQPVTVTSTGEAFSCAAWSEDGPGMLLTNVFGLDSEITMTVIWDVANIIRVDD